MTTSSIYTFLAYGTVTLLIVLCAFSVPVLCLAQTDEVVANQQMHNAGSSAPVVTYSLVEGGLPGGATGGSVIVTAAPLFVDADGPDGVAGTLDDDLRLQAASPAIDGGDNEALPPDVTDLDGDGDTSDRLAADLAGNTRIVDGGSGTAQVDLGPYEHAATSVAVEVPRDAPPAPYVLTAAYPNPFNPQTTLHFRLQHAEPVRIALYDLLGRERRVLYEGMPTPGRLHPLRIDGSDLSSGMYLVQLSGQDVRVTRPIMLVK